MEWVARDVGEEESALSHKASSLASIPARRLFLFCRRSISFSISFVHLALCCSCRARALIRASLVGYQLNVTQKRRHGGKEERNSDWPMDPDVDEPEEIDMAFGRQKGITATSKPAARDAHPMASQGDCMRLARVLLHRNHAPRCPAHRLGRLDGDALQKVQEVKRNLSRQDLPPFQLSRASAPRLHLPQQLSRLALERLRWPWMVPGQGHGCLDTDARSGRSIKVLHR